MLVGPGAGRKQIRKDRAAKNYEEKFRKRSGHRLQNATLVVSASGGAVDD